MSPERWPAYRAAGDAALLVEFGDTLDPEINRRALAFAEQVAQAHAPGITDSVPTYCAVLIHYEPLQLSFQTVTAWAQAQLAQTTPLTALRRHQIEIPTCYGGEAGPDLEFVAHYHHLTPEEVVRQHSRMDYTVYMMGFMPGFPYLGGLPPELETPRLETPRTRVPAGSVGLAGKQTGIYPLESPGGWRIIGQTAVKLFDPALDPPALLAPGDQVRFVPVARETARRGA
jgi:inhibitor of KinA